MKPTRNDTDNVKRLYFAELGLHWGYFPQQHEKPADFSAGFLLWSQKWSHMTLLFGVLVIKIILINCLPSAIRRRRQRAMNAYLEYLFFK